ncbi:MAG: acyltransferase [Novosphingobium sp.]|nr:acyltransferase [Novosphingobium sp.]
MDAPTATVARPRLARLDGLRGIAACGVAFAYHSQNAFAPGQFAGYGVVVEWLHVWGWAFVDLFFVLSGYVFAEVYLPDERLRAAGGWRAFWTARIARLYPLHLVMLLACTALFFARPENGPVAFAAHLLMLQAFIAPVGRSFDGLTWSLSVEAGCYLLFAIGAAAGRRALGWIGGVALVGSLVVLTLIGRAGGPWPNEVLLRGLLGFFLGQLLWRHRAALRHVPAGVLAAALAAGLLLDVGRWTPLLPLCLLAWPAALLLALRTSVMENRSFLWLGERSYAIYLIHLPLIEVIVQGFGKLSGGPAFVLAAHAAIALATLMLADLALRFVERPARAAIRARWGEGSPAAAPAVLPA